MKIVIFAAEGCKLIFKHVIAANHFRRTACRSQAPTRDGPCPISILVRAANW